MKFILCIVVCSPSLLFSAASSSQSDQSEKKSRVAEGAIRLRSVSEMGSRRDLSKGNPHYLKLVASCDESTRRRRRSKSGGAPSEALSRSADAMRSPRGGCLQRVASLKSVQRRLEREKEKKAFEECLLPHEQRVYSVLGYDDFMFAKNVSGLLDVLFEMLQNKRTEGQVHQAYTGYLRCRVETLSKKMLDNGIDPSDESSCTIQSVIAQAIGQKKYSPRLGDVPGSLEEASAQVEERLDEAQKAVLGTLETIAPIVETAVVVEEKE